ncbi:MAG: hypothetical protein F6K48_01010 [Okeania sp. SIO3H1]|nr:hypothetical protein [Okeania sp. SIO3H1]
MRSKVLWVRVGDRRQPTPRPSPSQPTPRPSPSPPGRGRQETGGTGN